MSKFSSLLPKVVLWILMVVSVAAFAMVFAGGSVDPTAEYLEPVYTDVLLYWIAAIVAIALVITLGFALVQLVKNFVKSPLATLESLVGPLLLVALLLFGYFGLTNFNFLTNDDIPAFDGVVSQSINQLSTMCMLGIGALALVAILLIIFSGLFKAKVKDA